MDAWAVPDRPRQETSGLREFLASEWLPRMFIEEYGEEALLRAEGHLPPPRPAALPKPGSQVKSLASLGQAVTHGGESTAWSGVALCLGAALVSLKSFTDWFRFFAQPPLDSKAAMANLLAKASALPDWEEMLLSPYFSAWASQILEAKLPVDLNKKAPRSPEVEGSDVGKLADILVAFEWPGGEAEMIEEWKASREAAERIRKGAKALQGPLLRAHHGHGPKRGGPAQGQPGRPGYAGQESALDGQGRGGIGIGSCT